MSISSFSKRDYLKLIPEYFICPFCNKKHYYDTKRYYEDDYMYHYECSGEENLPLTCFYNGIRSRKIRCHEHHHTNELSLCFNDTYCYWEIHGSIGEFRAKIDGKGKIPLKDMEDRENGTIILDFGNLNNRDVYLTFIYDQANSFGAVYAQKIKADIATREENLRQKEHELNAREKKLQAKEQEKRERDLRNLEQSLQQKEKELKALEQKLQEVKKAVLTALNPI